MAALLVDKSDLGDVLAAEPFCLAGLEQDPNRSDLTRLMGTICLRKGDLEGAASWFLRTTMLNPADVEALCNLGAVNQTMGQEQLALYAYNKALAINPNHLESLNNRSLLMRETGYYEEALSGWDRCLELNADDPYSNNNRGLALQSLCRIDEAIASYSRSCEIMPDYAQAWQNLAMSQLLAGDYANGWKNYEWRWRNTAFTSPHRNFSEPLWDGDFDLKGRTLLVHHEQGLGDTLHFARYLPLLIEQIFDRGRVIVEVQSSLADLVRDLVPRAQVVAAGGELPAFDVYCPLLSLPKFFGTTVETIPSQDSYLRADPALVEHWKDRLERDMPGNTRPKVGLVWSGGTAHFNDRNRSLTLAKLIEHLPDGFDYVSLQKEVRPYDQAVLAGNSKIAHYGAELKSFSDTAALCMLMDHVVSVDTSTAHLAAALGRPTSILLPRSPDWRWMMDRTDSPWYPSVRLCRQDAIRDWDSALKKVDFVGIQRG